MVKWINLILIISLFISCNSVNLAKYKSKNEAKSSFNIERNTKISETTLTKIKDFEKINFRLVEEKSSKQNTSEENNSISISEGEITKIDSQGNTTTIKGKGISTNNNSKSTITEEYLKREINLVKEQSQERLDSAVKKIDSTYKAKFESYVKQSEKQKEKKTTRFPIIIPIVLAIALLIYAVLKRHKIVQHEFRISRNNYKSSKRIWL